MHVSTLIGRRVVDLYVTVKFEFGGLDECDAWLALDDGRVIGFPWGIDEDLLDRERPPEARSVFAVPTRSWIQRKLDAWRAQRHLRSLGHNIEAVVQTTLPFHNARNRRIVDVITIDDPSARAFILLENGWLITHEAMAPHGTGNANVHFYTSLAELIGRHGSPTTRLSGGNGG